MQLQIMDENSVEEYCLFSIYHIIYAHSKHFIRLKYLIRTINRMQMINMKIPNLMIFTSLEGHSPHIYGFVLI